MDNRTLRAKYQGSLGVADKVLNCAVLEDGTRVLSASALYKAFGRSRRGANKDEQGRAQLPRFVESKSLKPFISGAFEGGHNNYAVQYMSKTGNTVFEGYRAEILPILCEAILKANDVGQVTEYQKDLVDASSALIRSFAKVGIIALIDEATGYQRDRDKDELQKLLSIYLSEERLQWAKRFPDEYYKQLFRLKGWTYNPLDVKRPKMVGHLTNELVYEKLPPGVLDKLKELNPVKNKRTWRRESTHHQHLSADIGQEDLKAHLLQLIAIMRISSNWDTFKKNFEMAFPPKDGRQLSLDVFDDE